MTRRSRLLAVLLVTVVAAGTWLAWDWIEAGYRTVIPHPERYQIVAVGVGMPVVVRLNTRTGSLAIYVVAPADSGPVPDFKATRVGYEPGPFR